MTDTEARRIVVQAMGKCLSDHYDPTINANHEQLLREWAWENLTDEELQRVSNECGRLALDRMPPDRPRSLCMFWSDTSDLTHAVARVLAERKEANND